MKILSIELENYRQYKDVQRIDFSEDDGKNFTVLEGANGAGKTNLLNAITWCLYGKEEHLSKTPKDLAMRIINEKTLSELRKNEVAHARVKLILGEGEPDFIFERTLVGRKDSKGRIILENNAPLTAFLRTKRDMKESAQANVTVHYVLPEGLKNFFFFDGEKLDEFFKAESNEKVKEAILGVSQINLLDIAVDHIAKTMKQIQKDAKGMSPKAQEILDEIDALEKPLIQEKKNLEDLRKGKKETAENLSDIETKLRESSLPLVQELQNKRDNLEKEIDSNEEELKNLEERSKKHLINTLPYVFSFNALQKTRKLIAEKYKKGQLPPKIRDTFLKELLKKGECICGTDISKKNKTERKKVEQLLKVATFSALTDEVTEGKFHVEDIIKETKGFVSTRNKINKEIRELEEKTEEYREELKELSTRLKKIDIEEITNLENAKIEFQKASDRLTRDISVKEYRIEHSKELIKTKRSEYKKEIKKEKKHSDLLSRVELCDESIRLLEKIKKELIDEVRKTIESKTKEYFLNLIWKKNTYVDIKIDDQYRVSVLNKLGSESLGSLSAGERQVLALSFMAALRDISGFDAPVVIDTPLGRISGDPKDNIAKSLPKYLEGTQVTLLVTDQEYTPPVRQKLSERVGKEYMLNFDEENFKTEVVEHD